MRGQSTLTQHSVAAHSAHVLQTSSLPARFVLDQSTMPEARQTSGCRAGTAAATRLPSHSCLLLLAALLLLLLSSSRSSVAAALVPAPPAAEASPPLAEAACRRAVEALYDDCAVSADRISLVYSRGSEAGPTAAEKEEAQQALAVAGLPPAR